MSKWSISGDRLWLHFKGNKRWFFVVLPPRRLTSFLSRQVSATMFADHPAKTKAAETEPSGNTRKASFTWCIVKYVYCNQNCTEANTLRKNSTLLSLCWRLSSELNTAVIPRPANCKESSWLYWNIALHFKQAGLLHIVQQLNTFCMFLPDIPRHVWWNYPGFVMIKVLHRTLP